MRPESDEADASVDSPRRPGSVKLMAGVMITIALLFAYPSAFGGYCAVKGCSGPREDVDRVAAAQFGVVLGVVAVLALTVAVCLIAGLWLPRVMYGVSAVAVVDGFVPPWLEGYGLYMPIILAGALTVAGTAVWSVRSSDVTCGGPQSSCQPRRS
jgi:hypothetical protein